MSCGRARVSLMRHTGDVVRGRLPETIELHSLACYNVRYSIYSGTNKGETLICKHSERCERGVKSNRKDQVSGSMRHPS